MTEERTNIPRKNRVQNPDLLFGMALNDHTKSNDETQSIDQKLPKSSPPLSLDLSDFEDIKEIGHGGMALIYSGRQISLGRRVALKILTAERAQDVLLRERFRVEAEAVAQLDHQNIVPIFEINDDAPYPFFTMRLMEGGNLAEWLNSEKTKPEFGKRHYLNRVVDLMEKVARAVHFAHQRGVIHRDLKPANILLDQDSEPHVSDFGLAKFVESNHDLTQTNAIMGTPAYMSPEQAAGNTSSVTIASDIFSLGSILYELLTGKIPFNGANQIEILKKVIEEDPVPISNQHTTIGTELGIICQRAMLKEPDNRYESALHFAEDLCRWKHGYPILAVAPSLRYRFKKFARRHKPSMIAAAVLLISVLSITGFSWHTSVIQSEIALVNRLMETPIENLPFLVEQHATLSPSLIKRLKAVPKLENNHQTTRLNSLLLPYDHSLLDEVKNAIPEASPEELTLILGSITKAEINLKTWLESQLKDKGQPGNRSLRHGIALAHLAPESQVLINNASMVSTHLIRQETYKIKTWASMLLPVRNILSEHLEQIFISDTDRDTLLNASQVLSLFERDNPDRLCQLAAKATPRQLPLLVERLKDHSETSWQPLRTMLDTHQSGSEEPLMFKHEIKKLLKAAITLTHLGDWHSIRPILANDRTEDPRLRSQLIHAFSIYGIQPRTLIQVLQKETNPGVIQAVLSAIGDYDEVWIPPQERERLKENIIRIHHESSHAGVRSMADWLFHHWYSERINSIKSLPIDAERSEKDYIDGESLRAPLNINMTVLKGPITFKMGSPKTSPHYLPDNLNVLHNCRIPRTFAIATEPVTHLQFEKFNPNFINERTGLNVPQSEKSYPDNGRAVVGLLLNDIRAFCNWISKIENIPESQYCYASNASGQFVEKPDILNLMGYRLPTEAEWEYAAGTGSRTPLFYGDDLELIDHYAWHQGNSQGRAYRSIIKRPNPLGLFGLYGSYPELCTGFMTIYPQLDDLDRMVEDNHLKRLDSDWFTARGSMLKLRSDRISNWYRARYKSSAIQSQPLSMITFRLAKTLMQH